MAKRFLKYETENTNIPVNNKGCLRAISYNDLVDKPFYEYVYTVDNITNFTAIDGLPNDMGLVSNLVIPHENLVGMNMNASGSSIVITQEMYQDYIDNGRITDDICNLEAVIIVYTEGATLYDYYFPYKGIYMCPADALKTEISWKEIKMIDEKFIPMTLTSPNGTQFKLSVSDDGTLTAVET